MEPNAASGASPGPARRFFATPPPAAWLCALLAALVHLFPVLHARAATPSGWTFTGNVTVSPDYMQYRAWMRQSRASGPLVENRFTAEPNRPHLPVLFYWAVGRTADATGATPEDVYAWSGALFAFLLVLLVFLVVRHFLPDGRGTWWVFLALLAGGGLGAHLKVLHQLEAVRESGLLGRVVGAVNAAPVFESYRSHYLFKTLFDSHFLLLWLLTLGAVLAFWAALRAFSPLRALLAAAACAAITLLHVYEAFTLGAIFATTWLLCRGKGIAARPAALTSLACGGAMLAVLAALFAIQRGSGLPLPDWKPEDAPFMSLVLAFPIAWPVIAWGFAPWWRGAGLDGCFLVGWALGCTLLALSYPYYPYADRAPMTMQVPVLVIAGAIWFARRERVGIAGALLLLLALGVAPAWEVRRLWKATEFDPRAPWMFLDAEHAATIAALRGAAGPEDVLLAEDRDYRWLVPEHPGRSYHAHFFLTVDHARKTERAARFYEGVEDRAEFLRAEGIRFVYVARAREPERFADVPGLAVVHAAEHGTLFAFAP